MEDSLLYPKKGKKESIFLLCLTDRARCDILMQDFWAGACGFPQAFCFLRKFSYYSFPPAAGKNKIRLEVQE